MTLVEVTRDGDAVALQGTRLTKVGLVFTQELSFEDWRDLGGMLAHFADVSRWAIGDWLNYGEHHYEHGQYDVAVEVTGLGSETVRNWRWVADRVESVRRRTDLSWAHHQEVAVLEPAEQDEWLDRAEKKHWSRNALRAQLHGPRALLEAGTVELPEQPLLRFMQADLPTPTVVALILRVFFPDAETALDMTYGSGGFWDGSAHVSVTAHDVDPARAPHGAADFRDLRYPDESFDVPLFDPPHLADSSTGSIMGDRFGTYPDADLRGVVQDGVREAWRLARLGCIVRVTDHVHGQRFVMQSAWVRDVVGQDPYDVVHQTRSHAMVDPKWNEQLSAYSNGSTYLVFRKDGPLHRRRMRQ
jgi:hypothetical protein